MSRSNQEADNIPEILKIIQAVKHPKLIWVGKNYSLDDLIRDLKKENITAPS